VVGGGGVVGVFFGGGEPSTLVVPPVKSKHRSFMSWLCTGNKSFRLYVYRSLLSNMLLIRYLCSQTKFE